MIRPTRIPIATYRLQFNRSFTFRDAIEIADYLRDLGISHVYASPYLKSHAGSRHGYDIVDHNALNPEIGDQGSFEQLVTALHAHGLGQILDIVPNHMDVGGNDNAWWLDVLEHGEASLYADFFDIDWHPADPELQNKLLLPFLGDRYGSVLERGELQLTFDPANGGFYVGYFAHRFPIDPQTYPDILSPEILEGRSASAIGVGAAELLAAILRDCRVLPRRTDLSPEQRRLRRQRGAECKRRLATLCREDAGASVLVAQYLAALNGEIGQPASFDRLHRLLDSQAWRLAYWQVATDEINYRRFFDINSLAALRMENREVFEATHGLVRELLSQGQIDGLRIDHPDGLYDPPRYFAELQELISDAAESRRPIYLVIEKILAAHERLPADWPVAGTTGYDAAALLNGLFVYPGSERRLTRLYRRFSGLDVDFDELLYERKKFIIRDTLSGELTVLANLLHRIAQADRHTRDFTYHGLLDALTEVVACLPVYRTYVSPRSPSEQDRRYIHWAIAKARKRSPSADAVLFDFVRTALLLENCSAHPPAFRDRIAQFTMRFQQYTAPVMAKGMEDTAFYIFNRLVSLNDVGFDPKTFGVSPTAFHHQNRQRSTEWPHSMVSTSTHDSKRSEDVRVRIDVISELPEEWQRHLARWSRLNRARKRIVEDQPVPSRNDEYLFYQTLLGVWPLEPIDESGLVALRERIEVYMLKAAREAKLRTSWINPDQAYEEGLSRFVRAVLHGADRSAFLADFAPFAHRVARFGLLNGLSQTLLKLTIPGVPDIYQGNELWNFCLVDPDNRRPVDYLHRRELLRAVMTEAAGARGAMKGFARGLLGTLEDGRAKLYLTWRTLGLRRRFPELFESGDYIGLEPSGDRADHLCAFARCRSETTVIVAAGRWFARLSISDDSAPIGAIWQDTWLELPTQAEVATAPGPAGYENILTAEWITPTLHEGKLRLHVSEVFADLPVALLLGENTSSR
jgi:(1->4)-alpha-D-glucan 1-alpha-D-glucosylmutase